MMEISRKECYERIYEWHKKHGKRRMEEKSKGNYSPYVKKYFDLVNSLPSPDEASEEDMDFVFDNVIANLLEWSYNEKDENGITMAQYAHAGLNQRYARGTHDELLLKSLRNSKLYARFINNHER